jgi:ribosome-interacting GTPase 1
MKASRGMGCIKKGATGKFAKKPVALKKGGTVKDACYKKVKASYKVFPSAYASGAIAKCRKKGK